MRTFLKKFGLFALVQASLLGAVLWSYNRQYPPKQNYLAAAMDKESLLRTQAAPRLIFVGGSSMAFGVNSARIAQACGRKPVNMGLHAALGLKYMLAQTEPYLQRGDWVIVAPEYEQFGRLTGASEFLANMVEIEPRQARLFDAAQWGAILDRGAIQRLGIEVRAVLKRPTRFFRRGKIAATRSYSRQWFNANGDVVHHLNLSSPGIGQKSIRIRPDSKLLQAGVDRLNDFARIAEQRGAKVWFSHPPLPLPAFEQNRAAIAKLDETLVRDLRMPCLDRAEDLTYPTDHFFDTWYHLARAGVEKRTEFLAARMAELAKAVPRERVAEAGRATLNMAVSGDPAH